ncbi:unnamed protein product, partial [Clonostachys rosea]
MDSFLPLGGFQLPFQQRLSRLYNDTKKSSDFVKEPFQNEEDPDIKALHRKLRIQKDRLVSWGLEWSDPKSAEIDESLSNAGLSEVVGSVMSTIKDILAEAEPLWLSSKHLTEPNRPSADRKPPLVRWDKTRFEDLVRDLTSSIDTLYDLSRTRSMGATPRPPPKVPPKDPLPSQDFRPFESSRMQTPQSIRPDSLTHLRPRQGKEGALEREVVFMSKTAYSELTHGTAREPWAPLLLEYATYDSIYSITGISPPMDRFEKLSAALQQDPQLSPKIWTGLPRLLGYFEDLDNSRFGLVYRFPPSFNAVSFEHVTKNPFYSLPTLADILNQPDAEPPLEAKFRLAHNLANTVFDMHARGITHGNLIPKNVCFTDSVTGPTVTIGEIDVRRPLVSSFDIFPEDGNSSGDASLISPREPRYSSSNITKDERIREFLSLATVLLSVGLWLPLESVTNISASGPIPQPMLKQLSQKCGTLYTRAVQACCSVMEQEKLGNSSIEDLLASAQTKVSKYLEACCALDSDNELDDRINSELQQSQPKAQSKLPVATTPPVGSSSKDLRDIKSPALFSPSPATPDPMTKGRDAVKVETNDLDAQQKAASRSEAKLKLYPHIPLPPDAVDKWNKILMPQINLALKQFYRKHPESVEISLESVGPSPAMTKPTVLVVCTSVGKVRAILKKRVGDLFDESTGFALKVCRGQVLRSRRDSSFPVRSMANRSHGSADNADSGEIDAINPEFQQRPGNGASIGAWIGDRHLPPVSFGGLVLVDDKVYGMTVHHMLDDPDRDFGQDEPTRSSAVPGHEWFDQSVAGSSADDDFSYELSDTESEAYSESDITSDWGDEDDEEDAFEPGDIPGIEPGCGDGYIVTQPALDDVEEGFYPSSETEDEDHLDTFSLGEMFASSGIRRKEVNGLVHEVDWALFEFSSDRVPEDNFIPRSTGFITAQSKASAILHPTAVAPFSSLPGLEVQCVARTSGLQTGQILPTLTSVKIYGRTSPSHTYQVASLPASKILEHNETPRAPIGIPGDSGAWIVDHRNGQLCGHVLAWSQRKRVAYICPMDVLLMDIAETLDATEIKLPTGEVILSSPQPIQKMGQYPGSISDGEDEADFYEDEVAPTLSKISQNSPNNGLVSSQDASSSLRMSSQGNIAALNRTMKELRVDCGIG